MSAFYRSDNELDVNEPFMFLLPPIYKSKLVLQDGYSIPLKTPKPGVVRRALTKVLLGWTYEDYIK
jgi:hypothetical protein